MIYRLVGCEGYLIPVVADLDLTESSIFTDTATLTYPAYQGRLNSIPGPGVGGAWCAEVNDATPWIEVNQRDAVLSTRHCVVWKSWLFPRMQSSFRARR